MRLQIEHKGTIMTNESRTFILTVAISVMVFLWLMTVAITTHRSTIACVENGGERKPGLYCKLGSI